MEGLFAVLVGALAVAAAPLVPVIRPVAKAAVLGGLALADAVTSAASAAGQQIDQLRSHNVIDATVSAVGEKAAAVAAAATAATAAVADKVSAIGGDASAVNATPVAVDSDATVDTAAESASHTAEVAHDAIADAEEGALSGDMEVTGDNLTLIDGIGPKVASILSSAGITTFAQLAAASEEQLRTILDNAGPRYRAMNPASWPAQASQFLASK